MRIVRFVMKNIFIICIFDVLDVSILLYKFDQTNLDYFNLGQNKMPYYIPGWME